MHKIVTMVETTTLIKCINAYQKSGSKTPKNEAFMKECQAELDWRQADPANELQRQKERAEFQKSIGL